MPPKRQHYVPQVYLRSWEVSVANAQPGEPACGVFLQNKADFLGGSFRSTESILYEKNGYTVDFSHSFLVQFCEGIRDDFGEQIKSLMSRRNVFALLDGKRLTTCEQLGDNMHRIEEWGFVYSDTHDQASNSREANSIKQIRSYYLEDLFSVEVENHWTVFLSVLEQSLTKAQSRAKPGEDLRVSSALIEKTVWMTLLMLYRNPTYDGFGIFPRLKEGLARLLSEELEKSAEFNQKFEQMWKEQSRGLWLTTIYKALHRSHDNHYVQLMADLLEKDQLVLFGIKEEVDGFFLTSDTPAFLHVCNVSRENNNGLYFPLTPDYLLCVFRNGEKEYDFIDYRELDMRALNTFNAIIRKNSHTNVVVYKP